MKKYYPSYIIFGILIGFGIGFIKKHIDSKRIDSDSQYYECESGVIEKGNIICYNRITSTPDKEWLLYSIIMANKYNYPKACYDFYWTLMGENILKNKKNDLSTVRLVFPFLRRGAEMRNYGCVEALMKMYSDGEYVDQDKNIVDSLKSVLHKLSTKDEKQK